MGKPIGHVILTRSSLCLPSMSVALGGLCVLTAAVAIGVSEARDGTGQPLLAPGNDVCGSAAPVALDTPVNGTTVAASNDYQLSGAACFSGFGQTASTATGRDVVYNFQAAAPGDYSFRVTGYSTPGNLVVYVAGTCPTGAPPVTVTTCLAAANRSSAGSAEEVMCLPLGAGQQAFIYVDDNGITAGNTFTLEVNRCSREIEANNAPSSANALACPIEGSIAPAGEADFYSLGNPAAHLDGHRSARAVRGHVPGGTAVRGHRRSDDAVRVRAIGDPVRSIGPRLRRHVRGRRSTHVRSIRKRMRLRSGTDGMRRRGGADVRRVVPTVRDLPSRRVG